VSFDFTTGGVDYQMRRLILGNLALIVLKLFTSIL